MRERSACSQVRRLVGLLMAVVPLAIFAAPVRGAERKSVLIQGVPHVQQKPDFCGEACVEMYLRKLKVSGDQDYVYDQSGLDPLLGRGCYTAEMIVALKRIGFIVGDPVIQIPVKTADAALNKEFSALYADLQAGIPSIICTRYGEGADSPEHFRLILGYDAETNEVIYNEPATARGAYRRMSRDLVLNLWPLKYREQEWTLVRMRLEPGPRGLVGGKVAAGFTEADYAQHIHALKSRLPHEGFSIVLQPPFVVIGDEPLETVRTRSKNTVKWAVDRLKREYFTNEPSEILDIWLFQDNASYEANSTKLTGTKPTTPYGFFSHTHKALIMNIATGGGTLVHEIVHPFIATNFPECPSWFNEGLASLYEQANEREGRIVGETNWRLKGLQTAIGKGTVPPFKTLCATTTREFYDRDPGTNYAQARYLCYYLQEHGLLVKYYETFRKNAAKDPTGYESLKAVLGEDDIPKFQQRWEAWVLKLKFG